MAKLIPDIHSGSRIIFDLGAVNITPPKNVDIIYHNILKSQIIFTPPNDKHTHNSI